MGLEWVEINRLSSTGESKRRIRCLSRHITVFRATVTKELDIFSSALYGSPTTDRFSILVDGAQFNPPDHTLIGFGESFSPSDPITVEQYINQWGANGDVEALLLRVGLGGLSRVKLTELTAAQGHTLRLLAAMNDPSKVLVIKEPFNNVPETFREAVAEMLAEFAWKKHAIVIVTHLSYRPKAWIENEVISRVQVERARQATIGFGGASRDVESSVSLKAADASSGAEKGSYPLIPPAKRKIGWAAYRTKSWIGLGAAAVGSVALVVMASFVDTSSTTPVSSPRADSGVLGAQTKGASAAPAQAGQSVSEMLNVSQPIALEQPQPKPTLIDKYPKEVRDAVLLAFNNPEESVKLWYKSAKVTSSVSWTGGENKDQLRAESRGNPTLADSAGDGSDSELAERREEIRRKFLEAIQGQQ